MMFPISPAEWWMLLIAAIPAAGAFMLFALAIFYIANGGW
jgi:hypothetical protein